MSTASLLKTPPSIPDPDPGPPIHILRKIELIYDDGEPMESDWHVKAMVLLVSSIDQHFRERDDYYVGGNMFIYFSETQARNRDFRGPDFYFVSDTTRLPMRKYWCVWEENGRTPDVVIELCSPSTIKEDYGRKKKVYESILHVVDYFCYDPDSGKLDGWRRSGKKFVALKANAQGRLWSDELGLWVGTWTGRIGRQEATWLRFFDEDGNLVLSENEAAARNAEEQRRNADEQRRRADAAEAELAQLRERVASAEKKPNGTNGKGKKK